MEQPVFVDKRRFLVAGRNAVHDLRMLQVCGSYRAAGVALNQDALKEEWLSVDRTKQRVEPTLEEAAHKLFLDQRDDLVSRAHIAESLRSLAPARAEIKALVEKINLVPLRADDPVDIQFDIAGWMRQKKGAPLIVRRLFRLAFWKDATEDLFAPLFPSVIEEGFLTASIRVGVEGATFSIGSDAAQRTLRASIRNIRGINDETARLLVKLVDNWLDADTDTDDLAQRITTTFNQYSIGRAGRIGRTSTGGLFEGGQQDAFEDAGIDKKRWLSRRDGVVRTGKFNHQKADGEEVDLKKFFKRTGEKMLHPLDPNGSAGNVVECRCTSLPIIVDDD